MSYTFQCITEYGSRHPPAYYAECCEINTSGPTVNQVGGISNIFQMYQILHIIKTLINTHLHSLIHPHPLTRKHNSHTSASHRIRYANVSSSNKHSYNFLLCGPLSPPMALYGDLACWWFGACIKSGVPNPISGDLPAEFRSNPDPTCLPVIIKCSRKILIGWLICVSSGLKLNSAGK